MSNSFWQLPSINLSDFGDRAQRIAEQLCDGGKA